jgi:hypothetical protein
MLPGVSRALCAAACHPSPGAGVLYLKLNGNLVTAI